MYHLFQLFILCLSVSLFGSGAKSNKDVMRNFKDGYDHDYMAAHVLHYIVEVERIFDPQQRWVAWYNPSKALNEVKDLKKHLTPLKQSTDLYNKALILQGNLEDLLSQSETHDRLSEVPLILKKLYAELFNPLSKTAQDFYDVANMYNGNREHPEITFFKKNDSELKDHLLMTALLFDQGHGIVEKDSEVAFLWYYRAYKEDASEGAVQVALRLIAGLGCPQNIKRGQQILTRLYPGKDQLPKAITQYLEPTLGKEWAFRVTVFTPILCLDLIMRALFPSYDSVCAPLFYMICIYGLEEFFTKPKDHYPLYDLEKYLKNLHTFKEMMIHYYQKLTPDAATSLINILSVELHPWMNQQIEKAQRLDLPKELVMTVSDTSPDDDKKNQ